VVPFGQGTACCAAQAPAETKKSHLVEFKVGEALWSKALRNKGGGLVGPAHGFAPSTVEAARKSCATCRPGDKAALISPLLVVRGPWRKDPHPAASSWGTERQT